MVSMLWGSMAEHANSHFDMRETDSGQEEFPLE